MHDAHEICDRYGPIVWRCVYRILGDYADAMDCCQEVLCEAWQNSCEKELHEAFMRWLATRRAIDRLRKRKRTQNRVQTDAQLTDVPVREPGPVNNAEYNELFDALRRCVAMLPGLQGEALWLRCVEEMSYSEIAKQLRIERNTVGVLIHRAKSQMRKVLANYSNRSLKD